MKCVPAFVVILMTFCSFSETFVMRHRRKKHSSKVKFQKIKKGEQLRLQAKKLIELERQIQERHNHSKLSSKWNHSPRTNKDAQHKRARELFLSKTHHPKTLKFKNLFALRKSKAMTIKSNLEKRSRLRKTHKRSHVNKLIMDRYLESHIKLSNKISLHREPRVLEKAKEKVAPKGTDDYDLKYKKTKGAGVSGINGGITYVERPKMTKPLYVNMSPIYDFRGY